MPAATVLRSRRGAWRCSHPWMPDTLHLMVPIERPMLWDAAHAYAKQLAKTWVANIDRSPLPPSGKPD